MKPCTRFLHLALVVGAAGSVALAQAAPLTTVRNSILSVPAAKLVGSNAMVSAVMPGTLHGGHAALVGAQEWLRQYSGESYNSQNRGHALAVRPDGSIVVTGYSREPATDYDFVTLAYAPDGTALWTNRYDSPEHGDDEPFLVATDESGDVWVAGQSAPDPTNWRVGNAVLIRYASNGLPLWTNLYTSFDTNSVYATALAVDGSGNAYIKASSSYFPPVGSGWPVEDALIQYDITGNVAWTRHYFTSAPDSGDGPHDVEALAMDRSGSLYFAGMSGSEHYETGTSIVKWGADGSGIWTNHHPPEFMSLPRSLSPVRDGGILVTSEGWNGSTVIYTVLKCSTNGASLWTNTLNGPLYEGGGVPMTVLDPAGNAFLVGGSPGADYSGGLYQILKLSRDGIPLWTNLHADFGLTNSMIYGSAADSAGNLYLTAYAMAPGRSDRDWVTVKYSGDGRAIWTNRFDGTAGRDDMPFALAVDGAGSVYVTGETENYYGSDLITVKYADLLYYTPPKDFTGSDTITYKVADNLGNSATGSVEVVVAPGAFQFNLAGGVTRFTPSGFQSQLVGAPATNAVVLETSPDLLHWQPVVTNAPVGNTVQFLDPAAAGLPQRFYRARQPQ
jgi:hypothetical protein